jgi:Paraquat-inducible protein B
VTSIVINYDIAKQVLRIPVRIALEADRFQIVSGERNPTKNINALIARGLRAQLESVSLVTGQTAVNFDFHPGRRFGSSATNGDPRDADDPFEHAGAGGQCYGRAAEVSKLPLDKFSDQISEALTSVNQLVQQAGGTVKGATNLIDNVNTQVKPLTTNVMATSDQANLMLQEARKRVELNPGEPLQNLNNVLADAGGWSTASTKTCPLSSAGGEAPGADERRRRSGSVPVSGRPAVHLAELAGVLRAQQHLD